MERWDTVVIGSGSAGLTAALALARAGQKVLVLEQHYLPGGWMQSFSLSGYRFSPGVHYIGDLDHGGRVRRMYEGLGLSQDLEFCELNPDGFDHFLIGGERFDVPKGFDRYFDRLVARFPHEREGLARYFNTINAIVDDLLKCERMLSFPSILLVPLRAPTLLRWGFGTQAALLDRTIRDPLLRAILSAQSGNHGLAPRRVSLPLHACIITHYYGGGFYPRGGAKRIPMAMIKQLRRHGGQIRLRTRVNRILLENGRAAGVELQGGERIRAGDVVSNADPAATFGKLLPPEVAGRERRKTERMEYSVGIISAFCAVDMDLAGMGYDSGNYWWYRTRDVEGIYERLNRDLPGDAVDGLFLTITTLKDPGHAPNGHHTIEMFTFAPYEPFARWAGTRQGDRGGEYDRFKQSLGDKLIAAAENIIPGISRHLVFREIATPLTNDFYCETVRGASYGTAKTPFQLGPLSFGIRTRVPHLYSCGSSTISHGVAGAATSGLIAAQHVLGVEQMEDLLGPADGSLRIYPADRPHEWLGAAEGARLRRRGASPGS